MWIVYFGGVASYWLVGGRSYTVGRKGTDIVIEADPTISRHHLTLAIEMTPQPGNQSQPSPALLLSRKPLPLVLTDLSKFGSKVLGCPMEHGKPRRFDTLDGDSVDVELGTQKTTLVLKWEPKRAFITRLADSEQAHVCEMMMKCGFYEVSSVAEADLVVATSLEPTAAVLTALARAIPIVDGIRYLDSVCTRISPKVPLADPASLLSLPQSMDPAWKHIACAAEVAPTVFLPQAPRSSLFNGITFVAIQMVLFDEVKSYIAAAHGHVTFDSPTLDQAEAFCVRHHSHVVLFTNLVPIDKAVFDAIQRAKLVVVEYTAVVQSLLLVKELALGEFPNIDAVVTQPKGSARAGQSGAKDTKAPPPPTNHKRPREEGSNEQQVAVTCPPKETPAHAATEAVPRMTVPEELRPSERLVVQSIVFPDWPCFSCHSGLSATAGSTKAFCKQRVCTSSVRYEMEAVAPAPIVPRRIPALDDDQIIPSAVADFSAFDESAFAARKTAGKGRSRPPQAQNQPLHGPQRRGGPTTETTAPAGNGRTHVEVEAPQPPPARTARKAVNIFDVDAIYD